MNRGQVRSGTYRSTAPDEAVQAVPSKSCTCTYSHAAKNMAMYVQGSRTRTRAYVRPEPCIRTAALDGSNGVQFIGSQPAGSERRKQCSVHREATDYVEMRPVHQEPTGLDGTVETGSCSSTLHRLGVWRTAKQTKRSSL
jgi:hypothetical protein